MKSLRLGLAALLMGVLAVGYFASQKAALASEAPAFAAKVDTPVVKWAALLALLVVVGFAFVPDRDQEAKPE